MSQFAHQNDINNLIRLDGELTRGPAPRWAKKMDSSLANSSINTSKKLLSLSVSYNQFGGNTAATGSGGNSSIALSKTPNKGDAKTKTPGKTRSKSKSPCKFLIRLNVQSPN